MKTKSLRSVRSCKRHGETEFYWGTNHSPPAYGRWICMKCNVENAHKYYISHLKDIRDRKHDRGVCQSMSENKECNSYLGIYIAERVLSRYFEDIIRMPNNNTGYDFICKNGFKIDVKSSCISKTGPKKNLDRWSFILNRNQIADYFLCLAFDNRDSLTPLHIWLIPGNIVNGLVSITIMNSNKILSKWSQYEKSLDKVIACCDTLRERGVEKK